MEVFIGNLPGEATIEELRNFVGEIHLHNNFECRKGWDMSNSNYYYFIARMNNCQDGEQLINKINGKLFHGRIVTAREFVQRASNDQENPCDEIERRINTNQPTEQMKLEL